MLQKIVFSSYSLSLVVVTFLRAKVHYYFGTCKMIEYLLLYRKRQSFQYFHILQYINQFFKTCLAFFLTLIKERKRKIDETIHKEGYPSVLHLNDKMLAIVGYTIDIKDAASEIIRFSRQFLILSAAVTDSPTILLFPSPWQHPYHSPASFWQSQGFASPCPFSFLQPGPLLYLLAWRYQSNS